jgi:hypothetical protein
VANTLAYYDTAIITAIKSFIVQAPELTTAVKSFIIQAQASLLAEEPLQLS